MVGYYGTTGEFFLVSANSSIVVFYNMRLGQEGGKENTPFLQAVSISFHNEKISMREGPFADFTINYFKKVLSGRLWGGEKNMCQSPEEKRLCASPFLWHDFLNQPAWCNFWSGLKHRRCLLWLLLALHYEFSTLEPGGMKELKKVEEELRRPKRVHDHCLEHPSGTHRF